MNINDSSISLCELRWTQCPCPTHHLFFLYSRETGRLWKKKNLRYSGRELNGELIIRNNYIKKIDILDTYYLIFNLNNDCDAVFGDL